MKFFNPYEEVRVTRHQLPHWQQPGAVYFITFRMADALPATLLDDWRRERDTWRAAHPPPLSHEDEMEYHRRFSSRIDQWLDSGHGSCLLGDPALRDTVSESLRHFDGDRYELFSWVIMPNHVHACFMQHPGWPLEKVIFTWKRRMAGAINRLRGAAGRFWMPDYFDRLIRDGDHLRNVIRYIRRNPLKARLQASQYTLWESELAKAVQ